MKLLKIIIVMLGMLSVQTTGAQTVSERLQSLRGFANNSIEQQFLHPDEAFRMSASVQDPSVISVRWQIADGYYLYHDKFTFEILGGNAKVNSAAVVVPPGKIKTDPAFGSVEVNIGDVIINVPLIRENTAEDSINLQVGYQGCKDNSLCYPPIVKTVPLILSALTAGSNIDASSAMPAPVVTGSQLSVPMVSEQDVYTRRLMEGSVLLNVLVFFGAGLLLSFTPCVFPMIPILSGIIVGQKKSLTPGRSLGLSLTYVLAMAATYAVVGIITAKAGVNVQAAAQNIWVISLFCLVFIALALSMFGFYEIQMPAGLQSKLISLSNSQTGGTLSGVAIMGVVSAVIVGPCVVPPLIGALAYISQTGNEVLGGAALFAMAMGMGVPLLIIGASAGSWLPRAGKWMDTIKKVFGVGLLGLAVWFLARVIPPAIELYLWAALLIVSAIYMGAMDQLDKTASWARLWKGLGIIMLIYGILLVIGASSGSVSIYQPLQGIAAITDGTPTGERLGFKRIKTVADLDAELMQASQAGKPVMLDFYADWCIECKRMEANTFPKAEVLAVLQDVVLIQADVTRNDELDKELLDRFGIYGPPAILFFGNDARERVPYRLFGFVGAEKFVSHVRVATAPGI